MNINDLTSTKQFFLLAGPCVIEGEEMALRIAERVAEITARLGMSSRGRIARRIGRALIPSRASVTSGRSVFSVRCASGWAFRP